MLHPAEPDNLITLALQAFGKYVSGVCLNFLKRWKERPLNDSLQKTCSNLQTTLSDNVPSSLVNEVTHMLLRCLDYMYDDIAYSWMEESWYEQVVQQFVNSVIHPSVTKLDFGPDYMHKLFCSCDWNFIVPFVCKRLNNLTNLKHLRLGKLQNAEWPENVLCSLVVPENLKEFTFMYNCNDAILESVCKTCFELKCLNISESLYVTDLSVDCILKLQHLEQLNAEKTNITEAGITSLLQGLASKTVSGFGYTWPCSSQLYSFGCGDATCHHLEVMIRTFPSLTVLNLTCVRKCNLQALELLTNLKCLSLSYVEFNEIETLLRLIGSQLQFLDICDVGPINLKVIGEECSSLRCLHITSSDTSTLLATEESLTPLPGFRSVKCLCLHLEYNPEMVQYLLCQCISVRVVDVTIGIGNDNAIINSVLKQNKLDLLEEFNWSSWSTSKLTRLSTIQIIEHCQNLMILRGPYMWRRSGNIRSLMKGYSLHDTF